MQLSFLLPANCLNAQFSDNESVVALFMPLLQTFVAEVEAQFSLWQKLSERHLEILDWKSAYQQCDFDIYPAIRILLSILDTLPVSSVAPKKSFSAVSFLKSNLRTTMTKSRQHVLNLIYIYTQWYGQ